jgi:hypothetical protein
MTAQQAPSRNDPCPCGSGRKYKKCCGAPGTRPPIPAQPWHDLDERLIKELGDFGHRRFGVAWKQLLDDYPVPEAAMEQEPTHVNLFIQWACHEKKFDGQSVGRHFLDARGRNLLTGDRAWLEAHGRAWLSLWEVDDVEPGAWIDLLDLLTGERRRVVEVGGSRDLHKRLTLLARVVDHAGMSMLCGSHPYPLPPDAAQRVRDALREEVGPVWTKQVPAAELRAGEVPTLLINLWQEEVETLAHRPLPELRNSDGDALVLVEDTFALVGAGTRAELTKRFAAEPDIQPPEGPRAPFIIETRTPGAEDAPTTLVAHVTLTARELRLDTNSRERADRLRARLERLADGRLRHKRRTERDPREMMAEARQRDGTRDERRSAALEGPAADEAILSFKRHHYVDWVDHPLPAVDGLSPREAASNPALRARLVLLLKEMEEHEGRSPPGRRFDFDTIRRQLGLI